MTAAMRLRAGPACRTASSARPRSRAGTRASACSAILDYHSLMFEFSNKVMTRRMSAFLRGAGSIMDIGPATAAYDQFVPKGTAESRLEAVWVRVGKHLRVAAREVRNDSTTQPKKVA